MKLRKLLAPLLVGMVAHTLTSSAGDLYLANLRGTCKVLGDGDRITIVPINNSTLLRDFAASQDPQLDPRSLKLVYDEDGDRIAVADTTGTIVGEILTFGFPTVVANSVDSQRERHVYIFRPGVSDAAGSGILTERITRNTEGITIRRSTQGRLFYAVPATEVSGAQVCNGTFTLGRKIVIPAPAP